MRAGKLAHGAVVALQAGLVASPLVVASVLPPWMPRLLGFVVAHGSWLVAAGLAASVVSAVLAGSADRLRAIRVRAESRLRVMAGAPAAPAVFGAVVFAVALLTVPGWRRFGPAGGDEPKYLRIAASLASDLDADIARDEGLPADAARVVRNVRRLAATTFATIGALARGERPPAEHAWALSNWTIVAWNGGAWHVQGPGLPALLAPGLLAGAADPPLMPPRAFVLLAALFAVAVAQSALLGAEVSGSRIAGFLAAVLLAASPAAVVVSWHLYPEAAAAAALPWLVRFARPGGSEPRALRAAAIGLVAGSFAWLHVKLLLAGAVAAALVAWRLRRRAVPLALLAASFGAPTLAFLLYQYRLTGLFRPDGLYLRYASGVWTGVSGLAPGRLLEGLANGLVGGRDGILVMALPVVAALLAVPRLMRRDPGGAVVLFVVAAALWTSAAVHGGGAPGPPGRLMAPAVGLFAAPLAVGLVELRSRLAFRWATAALVLAALAVTLTMAEDPRRTVKPYRGLRPAVDVSRDLPDGAAGDWATVACDLARAAAVVAAIGFWASRFARDAPAADAAPEPSARATPADPRRAAWREAIAFHGGAWLTLVALALVLSLFSTVSP
jgi:hypothetical protein